MALFQKKESLKVLFVTSEQFPFVKVGGLGEVMFSLPRALRELGCDARVMMPRYGSIDKDLYDTRLVYEGLMVPTAPERGGKELQCNVLRWDETSDPRSAVTTYFLENQEYYELRSNVYGYIDDRIRFALLSRGCLEFLNATREWMPDIIVTTDWMTGYLPNYLKVDYRDYERLGHLTTIFSIHNIYSQGPTRRFRFIQETELDDGHGSVPDLFSPRLQDINAMRRGIMYSDVINTVSSTYAKEIMTPEFGEGLDALLRERRDCLFGILNGIDYETNNPATDTFITKNFTSKTLPLRVENKIALQRRFGLPEDPDAFVSGIISRLSHQKGFTLFVPIIEQFLKATESQLVVLGTGDSELMDFFHTLEAKFPNNVRAHLQYDAALPHVIYGGSDVILIPSQFEPSGLTQMEAMRFGAVPVARRVGGLADTIVDYSSENKTGTGFLFDDFDSISLLIALVRAFVSWQHRDSWRKLQERAMNVDFSWEHSARDYIELFRKAIKIKNGIASNGNNIPSQTHS